MKAVVGLFKRREEADRAIKALEATGFDRNNFSLLAQDNIAQVVDREEDREEGTVQAEDKLGPAGGAAVGGLTGLLVGIGALVIPGVGPVLAVGSLATALGATAAATGVGAAAGGLLGALTSLGISEEEASFYAEGIKRGGILVVVEAKDTHESQAAELMRQAGAVEVDVQRATWQSQGWTGFDETVLPDKNYPRL